MAKAQRVIIKFLCFFLKIYQLFFSRLFPASCRFYPSCSSYAIEALEKKGVMIGTYYILKRLLRCHPWCEGGYDPIKP